MILIIDDNIMLSDILDHYIEGYEHLTVNSLEELKLVPEETIKSVSKVLTDMRLAPDVDAYTVKEYIRAINKDADIILMSGAPPSDKTAADFDGVLLKPFGGKAMVDILTK
jgi:CheY-like chemotaxis protein